MAMGSHELIELVGLLDGDGTPVSEAFPESGVSNAFIADGGEFHASAGLKCLDVPL
jgi:hypothetical protein